MILVAHSEIFTIPSLRSCSTLVLTFNEWKEYKGNCSLLPDFLTLLSVTLVHRNLLVVTELVINGTLTRPWCVDSVGAVPQDGCSRVQRSMSLWNTLVLLGMSSGGYIGSSFQRVRLQPAHLFLVRQFFSLTLIHYCLKLLVRVPLTTGWFLV